jgi:hypothetical protein
MDLEANREGRVSAEQRQMLNRRKRWRYGGVMASMLIVTIMPGFALLRPVIMGEITFEAWVNDFPNVDLSFLMLFPLLFICAVSVSYLLGRDLRQERVSEVVGKAKLWKKNAPPRHLVEIGGTRFQVSRDQWQQFANDATYHVYYIKNFPNHIMLSMERAD